MALRVGVLALQGGFAEHIAHLKKAAAMLATDKTVSIGRSFFLSFFFSFFLFSLEKLVDERKGRQDGSQLFSSCPFFSFSSGFFLFQ